MSLDVYLTIPGHEGAAPEGSDIFVRENGSTREISRAEWGERFPGREPVVYRGERDPQEVYTSNVTHNLNRMAEAAGIYEHLWRPDEIGVTTAGQLVGPLKTGLQRLRTDPERFKALNPENGWGSYETLVEFVADYLAACEGHPDALVSVWR